MDHGLINAAILLIVDLAWHSADHGLSIACRSPLSSVIKSAIFPTYIGSRATSPLSSAISMSSALFFARATDTWGNVSSLSFNIALMLPKALGTGRTGYGHGHSTGPPR